MPSPVELGDLVLPDKQVYHARQERGPRNYDGFQ
jgi:hypothetical protein